MAKLPTFKRVVKEDFSTEEQALIDKLGYLINGNFEPVYFALNKGLTVGDNLNQQIGSINVKVDASGRLLTTPDLRLTIVGGVQGITPISCFPAPNAAPWINWEQASANLLKLRSISGLDPNVTYSLKFLILGN